MQDREHVLEEPANHKVEDPSQTTDQDEASLVEVTGAEATDQNHQDSEVENQQLMEALNQQFGEYSEEAREQLLEQDDYELVHPVPNTDWKAQIQQSEDPVKSALAFWARYPQPEHQAKEVLLEMIQQFPAAANEVQKLTWWVYGNRTSGRSESESESFNEGKILLYRAVKEGRDPSVRPYESLTANREFAASLCGTTRSLVTYEVPFTHIFAAYDTSKSLADLYTNHEQEVIINSLPQGEIAVVDIDSSILEFERKKQILATMLKESAKVEGATYQSFLASPQFQALQEGLTEEQNEAMLQLVRQESNL